MKKPPKTKLPLLVEIEWIDSEAWNGVWDRIEDVREAYRTSGFDTIRSIGFMIEDRPDGVTICMSLHQNKGGTDSSRGALFYSIPRGCIKKIRKLA